MHKHVYTRTRHTITYTFVISDTDHAQTRLYTHVAYIHISDTHDDAQTVYRFYTHTQVKNIQFRCEPRYTYLLFLPAGGRAAHPQF